MKKCYCCQEILDSSHDFYPDMCPECGDINFYNRNKSEDLNGYVALVTGARIKIGYYTALRLLRSGAEVIVTSRFPYSALQEYQKEKDYDLWAGRLYIKHLDMLDFNEINYFLESLYKEFSHLDILINNAALTVKDEKGYLEQIEIERKLYLTDKDKPIPLSHSLGKIENLLQSTSIENYYNENDKNNWVKYSQDISIRDLLEVQIINSVGPYLLTTALKTLLEASKHKNKFVINVSSIEGKFNIKRKSSAHPHTNMAKAALNMMTKTLAREYRKSDIVLYSVDPGWVSNQFPEDWNNKIRKMPLDFYDSAARITHPVFEWKETEKPVTGVFLKDYKLSEW